ncbi:hypothetical protein F4810DRAFT_709311 [Camillea tinctor]|nr:hypothetical protein F4810DRAFT_709311 [Camillea tinctor]
MAAFAFNASSSNMSFGRSGYNKDGDNEDGLRSFGRSGYNKDGDNEDGLRCYGRSGYNKDGDDERANQLSKLNVQAIASTHTSSPTTLVANGHIVSTSSFLSSLSQHRIGVIPTISLNDNTILSIIGCTIKTCTNTPADPRGSGT